MNGHIKFICYGESVENLKLSCQYNVIGIPQSTHFIEGEEVYFVIKINGLWYVCGKANMLTETDINPFENYYTYSYNNFEACKPFSINAESKRILGIYWGLIFQRPKDITNKEFYEFITKNFIKTSSRDMLDTLNELK